MTANWTRCGGRQPTVAPASSSTAGERRVGMIVASAGRSTPGKRPKAACAAMTEAPVWPALKSASAWPSRTASAATRIEARGLRRSASAGLSDISTRSGASMIWTSMRRNRLATGWRASSASIAAASPTSSSPTCRCLAATSAPSTTTDGPASPPMASIAIRIAAGSCQLPASSWKRDAGGWNLFFDRLDLPAGVIAAVTAHLVRELHFVALRTLAAADRRQRVVRPALGRAGLRMSAFGIRHRSATPLFLTSLGGGPSFVPHLAARSRPFGLPSGARLLAVAILHETLQHRQPWIGPLGRAGAGPLVQIRPAVHAQAFAHGLAQRFHRQREHELLVHQLAEVDRVFPVEGGRQIVFGDFPLGIFLMSGLADGHGQRHVAQLERAVDRNL